MTCGEWDNVVADDEIVERAMAKAAEDQVRHVTTRYVREEVIAERDQRIAELESEVAALREDKERLDWLECYSVLRIESYTSNGQLLKYITAPGTALYSYGPGLRAAIDAARGKG